MIYLKYAFSTPIFGIGVNLCPLLTTHQLAKASSLALISMIVIIVTIIVQGGKVSLEDRGDLKGSLFIRNGVFQAIGVISFGEAIESYRRIY